MAFLSRVVLFVLANLGVLAVLSVSLRVLGVEAWLAKQGMAGQFNGLLVMAAIMGFGGAFISLAMSKWLAKSSMGVEVITQPRDETERWLLDTVRRQAEAAGIGMPEVGIFDSPAPNAFATGMIRDDALVAVSTGLLEHMNADEVEAVLGHEISHIANGDMVTMGLLQGVLNTFVVFFARVIGLFVDSLLRGRSQEEDENTEQNTGPGPGYWIASLVAELVLGLVATLIAMWFSRYREYRADAGGAQLAGRQKMIAALQALQRAQEARQPLPGELAAFGIDGGSGGLAALFLSHPPLEKRIAALQTLPD